MDVALAQFILSQRTVAAYQDTQVSMLRKSLDTQEATAAKLVDSMTSLPLATEGSVGRNVNVYA